MKSILAVSIAAVATTSALASQAKLPAPIADYYKKSDALTIKLDVAGLEKLMTATYAPDYSAMEMADKSGKSEKRTAAQDIELMKRQMKVFTSFSRVQTTVTKFSLTKDSATVHGSVSVAGTFNGGDNKPHKITVSETGLDTWVKVGGTWKMKVSKSLTEKVTIDGKVQN